MAGKWDKSGNQRISLDGTPEVGARCYFFEAASTTPLTTYSDYSLAVTNPAFVETDSYGTWPPVYFDDSESAFFRERATNEGGSVIYFDNDAVPIVGPGEGGGAEVPVDPNALLETGDIKVRYGTGVKEGFVRANGRTIGSATSGAAERANADTQDLFEYLWGADANLTVSAGRGASATADFEANKTIVLPDFRGRIIAALDDMGASAAGTITGLTTLGEVMGSEDYTLLTTDLPALSGTTSSNGAHTHFIVKNQVDGVALSASNHAVREVSGSSDSNDYELQASASTPDYGLTSSNGAHTHTVTVNAGPADPISLLPPIMGVTVYLKL